MTSGILRNSSYAISHFLHTPQNLVVKIGIYLLFTLWHIYRVLKLSIFEALLLFPSLSFYIGCRHFGLKYWTFSALIFVFIAFQNSRLPNRFWGSRLIKRSERIQNYQSFEEWTWVWPEICVWLVFEAPPWPVSKISHPVAFPDLLSMSDNFTVYLRGIFFRENKDNIESTLFAAISRLPVLQPPVLSIFPSLCFGGYSRVHSK